MLSKTYLAAEDSSTESSPLTGNAKSIAKDGHSPWSSRLADRYGMQLPPDLAAWFDSELWSMAGPGEFASAVTPQILLDEAPGTIWPPLMPPFFLPLLTNDAGDWLCLRLRDANGPTDVCHWYHGGGDWIPWGKSLAEAILFDCVLPRLPGADQRHAEPAETMRPSMCVDEAADHPWWNWATEQVGISSALLKEPTGSALAEMMIQRSVSEVAVRCQCVIDALSNPLAAIASPSLAERCHLRWHDLMHWAFDLRQLPSGMARQLADQTSLHLGDLSPSHQDWSAVAKHAREVSQQAPDLAWGHELLAYDHHCAGDHESAAGDFAAALRCSVYTDQSVRLGTHWSTARESDPTKMAAYFLSQDTYQAYRLDPRKQLVGDSIHRIPDAVKDVDLLEVLSGPNSRSRAMSYFECLADSLVEHSPASAAALYLAAGWDQGAEPMQAFAGLLIKLADACEQAGWKAHATLAAVHRRCLQTRYGL
ncbi:MAG: SMI1/KNR4 family protein [Planctomycetota bacterium]